MDESPGTCREGRAPWLSKKSSFSFAGRLQRTRLSIPASAAPDEEPLPSSQLPKCSTTSSTAFANRALGSPLRGREERPGGSSPRWHALNAAAPKIANVDTTFFTQSTAWGSSPAPLSTHSTKDLLNGKLKSRPASRKCPQSLRSPACTAAWWPLGPLDLPSCLPKCQMSGPCSKAHPAVTQRLANLTSTSSSGSD